MTVPSRIVRWAWYPSLLALAFVVEPYARLNVEVVSGTRVLLVALAIGATATVLWALLLGVDRGGAAAGLTVLAIVVATTGDRLALFAAAIALIVVEWAWVRRGTMRIRIPWSRVTEILNIVLLVVVALQVGRGVWLRAEAPVVQAPESWATTPGPGLPDIFVILADGHGRGDVLANGYGYDMAELRQALTADGLDEATRSHANYPLTRFALAVLFNGRPLEKLGQDMTQSADDGLASAALSNSSGMKLLESAGYESTIIASGYEHLGMRGNGMYVDVGPRNEMEAAILSATALGIQLDTLTAGDLSDKRTRVLLEIETLRSVSGRPSEAPQFVFTHLPVPHRPLVLREDCSLRPRDGYSVGRPDVRGNQKENETAVRAAADQARCTDRLIADVVHDIVTARPDAVVIVVSDHGPEERLDWRAPDATGIADRMANLFWARTPGHPGLFPEDITLVNVLPILFNAYLGTDLPLHPNDLWFGPSDANDHFVRYEPAAP